MCIVLQAKANAFSDGHIEIYLIRVLFLNILGVNPQSTKMETRLICVLFLTTFATFDKTSYDGDTSNMCIVSISI